MTEPTKSENGARGMLSDDEVDAQIEMITGASDGENTDAPPPKKKRRAKRAPRVVADAPVEASAPEADTVKISIDPRALATMLAGMADGMYEGICSLRSYPQVVAPQPMARATFVDALEAYLKTKGGDLPPGVAVLMTATVCYAFPIIAMEVAKRRA